MPLINEQIQQGDYNYKAIFDERKVEKAEQYAEYEYTLVGDTYPQIDDDIDQQCDILNSDQSTDDDKRRAYAKGIPLISIRYHPDLTRYQLIEKILTKLERCSAIWNTPDELTNERIKEIFDCMISSTPIDQVVGKFTLSELSIYGW